jgi:hypothetical protein
MVDDTATEDWHATVVSKRGTIGSAEVFSTKLKHRACDQVVTGILILIKQTWLHSRFKYDNTGVRKVNTATRQQK